MKTKFVVLVIALVGVAVCCKKTKEEPVPSPAPAEAKTAEPAIAQPSEPEAQQEEPEAVSVQAYADAVISIGNLLNADSISWPELEAKYKVVGSHLAGIDKEHGTSFGKDIPAALASIKHGEAVEVSRHVVTKNLQFATVLTIKKLMDSLPTAEMENAKKTATEIKSAFSAIEPTFKRRDDTVYDGKPTLVTALESALAQLDAVENKSALTGAAMQLSTLLSKVYVLSVLFEMKGVEEFCGAKNKIADKCAVKRVESGIYYRIIKDGVASKDKEADSTIDNMINSEHAVPSYETTRDLLAKVFPFNKEDLTF